MTTLTSILSRIARGRVYDRGSVWPPTVAGAPRYGAACTCDDRRAVEEAATLGANVLVLVCE